MSHPQLLGFTIRCFLFGISIENDALIFDLCGCRDLDENLQKALHKYLEVRGIKSSLFDFLHEYMLAKDEREYLTWLKNMKEFVAK